MMRDETKGLTYDRMRQIERHAGMMPDTAALDLILELMAEVKRLRTQARIDLVAIKRALSVVDAYAVGNDNLDCGFLRDTQDLARDRIAEPRP